MCLPGVHRPIHLLLLWPKGSILLHPIVARVESDAKLRILEVHALTWQPEHWHECLQRLCEAAATQ